MSVRQSLELKRASVKFITVQLYYNDGKGNTTDTSLFCFNQSNGKYRMFKDSGNWQRAHNWRLNHEEEVVEYDEHTNEWFTFFGRSHWDLNHSLYKIIMNAKFNLTVEKELKT